MFLHYLRVSLRNLLKYKAQTVISIAAMAASLTLMAIVSAVVLSIKPMPLLSQPYADRTFQFSMSDDVRSRFIDPETMSTLSGHQFRNAEECHNALAGIRALSITTRTSQDEERTRMADAMVADKDFLRFNAMKSARSGKTIRSISENETVITEKLAKKLFGKENPIGKSVSVHFYYYEDGPVDKSFTVKDVMENPTPDHRLIHLQNSIVVSEDHILKDNRYNCWFVLKEGSSPEALTEEIKSLLGVPEVRLINMRNLYANEYGVLVRNAIIAFLFLFVLVSFSNFMRQQTQLFRLREREVALRTCVGGHASSLFILFSTEILIVLFLTLALTITLVILTSDFLISNYSMLFEEENYSLQDAVPVALTAVAVLIAISLIVVAVTIWRIRRAQTGLALRMRPLPRHRLRNVGITLQMTVCLAFTCITLMFFLSVKGIKDYFGIPADSERYKDLITVRLNGITQEENKEIYERIETLKSAEHIYKFYSFMTSITFDEEKNDYLTYTAIYQNDLDAMDLYAIKAHNLPGEVNPDRHVWISEDFRKELADRNLWNGKSVNLPYIGEYEVKGIFDRIPFENVNYQKAVIIYDSSKPYYNQYERIIMPKTGREKETREAIEDIIKDVLPSRIDIKPTSFYEKATNEYGVINTFISIIYILSAISIVTTIAAIYSGVALDTRRRRKEMALRKLNGATPKVIAMIFLRTYIWIIAVAAILALPLCVLASDPLKKVFQGFESGNVAIAFALALLLILAVTALTIAWKIRDIMRADPIEYLKD